MQDTTPERIEALLLDLFRRNVKKAQRDRVRGDARLSADLGMDSLGVLSTMLAAEEELKLPVFPLPPEVAEIHTVGDVVALFTGLAQARPG